MDDESNENNDEAPEYPPPPAPAAVEENDEDGEEEEPADIETLQEMVASLQVHLWLCNSLREMLSFSSKLTISCANCQRYERAKKRQQRRRAHSAPLLSSRKSSKLF